MDADNGTAACVLRVVQVRPQTDVAMSEEPAANLWDEVAAICAKLGYEPSTVRRMDIGLKEVTLEVYRLNAEGKKFLDLFDTAAMDTVTLPISTRPEAASL